jgi:hypothetical protein
MDTTPWHERHTGLLSGTADRRLMLALISGAHKGIWKTDWEVSQPEPWECAGQTGMFSRANLLGL